MRTTTFLAATVLIALSLVAAPAALVAQTASANTCTPHLVEGDVKSYTRCTEQQCNWRDFPNGRPVCTD